MNLRIVSGAQTGADRGALDAALAAGLQIGGWAPSGWRSEDGCIPLVYRQYMRLSISPEYKLRTRLNVQDSDATLILSFADRLTGGSKFTADTAKQQRKHCKHLVLPRGRGVVPAEVTAALWDWIGEKRIAVLNVAGPRESKEPGIQAAVKQVIADLLRAKRDADTTAELAVQDAEADASMATEPALAAAERAESVRRMIDMGLQMRPRKPVDEFIAGVAAKVSRTLEAELPSPWPRYEPARFRREDGTEFDGTLVTTQPLVQGTARLGPPTHQESLPVEPAKYVPEPDEEAGKWDYHLDEPESDLEFFIASCAAATTAEEFGNRSRRLIGRYYSMDGNGVGGSLHVVLDDGNHERSSVEFCLDYAIKDGDKAGEALARALLALPDDVYDKVLPPMEDPCEGCGGPEGLHASGCRLRPEGT